jgi:hypothetical protein
MKQYIDKIKTELDILCSDIQKDNTFKNEIDWQFSFLSPWSNAKNISDIKLVIIGQDPTIQSIKNNTNTKRQSEIQSTLDLVQKKFEVL